MNLDSQARLSTRFFMFVIVSFFVGCSGTNGNSAASSGKKTAYDQSTPQALAKSSFDAFTEKDVEGFASLYHPEALESIKTFAVALFEYKGDAQSLKHLKSLFEPFETTKAVKNASGNELMATMYKNSMAMIPDFDEMIKDYKMTILGEINEGSETIHVIVRNMLPRPNAVSCKEMDGKWYLLLNDEQLKMIQNFKMLEHFEGNLALAVAATRPEINTVDVVGHVMDGEEVAQVLCRSTMKMDEFKIATLGCYPVRKGEVAWEHLNDSDSTELAKAMKDNWEKKQQELLAPLTDDEGEEDR